MRKAFYYKNYAFDEKKGELALHYAVKCPDGDFDFTEKIIFPDAPFDLSFSQEKALHHIFFLTHIAFGISYYKAFCPEDIVVESGVLSPDEAAFFERFFESGLGEFAIRNHLNLQGKIVFPSRKKEIDPIDLTLPEKCLIPVGGGKDSCLTIELLKQTPLSCRAISVGNPRPIRACVQTASLPHTVLTRIISPKLIELNQTGTVLNGHVPITGMLAFLLWASGVIYGYRYVALSCERSANSGNLMQGALQINHQYSKSFEFEKNFYALTQKYTPDFRYFSLLRPFSEIAIARLFAQKCESYFPVFTSCNKAFKIDAAKRLDRWCGCCDKCRFVFLILAPFMKKETLVRCVAANPLNDADQLNGFKELLGLCGHKPFECVGETQESLFAFARLCSHYEWENDVVIQALKEEVLKSVSGVKKADLFACASEHLIPKEIYKEILPTFHCEENG